MDVEKRLAADVEVFDQILDGTDVDAILSRTFAAFHTIDGNCSSTTPEVLPDSQCAVGRASAPSEIDSYVDGEKDQVLRELDMWRSRAVEGEAWSCRRTAELLEVLDRDEEAIKWWRLAANSGDLDAQDYVKEILDN
ncbi:hypothetical protein AB0G02_08975 [Actinosynnema sp. NPDC023658]|uniref:hypothetical protein n=1 Tax=Actinosynnema sp. NPDC023658 TaxID=3155465 RepID=UPI0033D8D363